MLRWAGNVAFEGPAPFEYAPSSPLADPVQDVLTAPYVIKVASYTLITSDALRRFLAAASSHGFVEPTIDAPQGAVHFRDASAPVPASAFKGSELGTFTVFFERAAVSLVTQRIVGPHDVTITDEQVFSPAQLRLETCDGAAWSRIRTMCGAPLAPCDYVTLVVLADDSPEEWIDFLGLLAAASPSERRYVWVSPIQGVAARETLRRMNGAYYFPFVRARWPVSSDHG